MAKKTILGIDIGYDQLKLALVNGRKVQKTALAQMPKNLLKEGTFTSIETMAELIQLTMKENHIRANLAAFVLPNEAVYVKNVKMPEMNIDQLLYNLPFEFNDYITGEIKDYVFDYAVLEKEEGEEEEAQQGQPAQPEQLVQQTDPFAQTGEEEDEHFENDKPPATMELMAVGAQRLVLEQAREFLKKAGLKMVIAAPTLCTYIQLIRAQQESLLEIADEFGILDLGYSSIRMYIYKKDRHMATRALDIGLSTLDSVLADAYGVDTHLAHTYLMSNFENCQEREECISSYDNIAIELMRALNFYRFSNPDSTLSDLWLCGGGAVIRPLREAIDDMLDMEIHSATELVPGGDQIEDCSSFVQAIGITFE